MLHVDTCRFVRQRARGRRLRAKGAGKLVADGWTGGWSGTEDEVVRLLASSFLKDGFHRCAACLPPVDERGQTPSA